MGLEDLSEDLLAKIFELERFRTSNAPLAAWLCGNRKLMAKMVNRGIAVVKLLYSYQREPVRIPECVQHWQLTSFCIHTDFRGRVDPETMLRDTTLLSSNESLKTLELDFENSSHILTSKLPPPPVVAKRQPASYGRKGKPQPQNTSTVPTEPLERPFPNLETLHLNCSASIDLHRLFPILARSLTSLKLESHDPLPITVATFGDLPPSLRHLSLPPTALVSDSALRTLPKSNIIEVFECPLHTNAFTLLVKDCNTLLPQLIDFPLPVSNAWYTELGFNKEGVVPLPQYPPNMRSIDLKDFKVNQQIPLPSGLRTLIYSEGTIGSDSLTKWMPSALTKLKVGKIKWIEIESKDWPPTLSALDCMEFSFAFAEVHRLPRSLTHLEPATFGSAWEERQFDEKAALSLGHRLLLENEVDRRLWSVAKQELLAESAKTDDLEKKDIIERYILSVENGGLFGLPIGMTLMRLAVFPKVVPPRLRMLGCHLKAHEVERQLGANAKEFFDLLPPSVSIYGSDGMLSLRNSFYSVPTRT